MDIGGPASTLCQQILLKLRYRVLSNKIIFSEYDGKRYRVFAEE